MGTGITVVSVLFQFAAAILAARLAFCSRRLLLLPLALAVLLMGVLRTFSLYNQLAFDRSIDLGAEIIALTISVLMLLGLVGLRRWVAMNRSGADQGPSQSGLAEARGIAVPRLAEKKLQKAHDELESRVEQRTADLVLANEKLADEIEKHTQTEQALRRSEERLDLAVSGTSDGVWDWDIEAEKVYRSPRFKEMLGYKEGEVEATFDQLFAIVHPEDQEDVRDAIRLHLEENRAYDIEFRMQTKCEEYLWFQSRGEALRDETGKAYRMTGSIRDISDRKQAEDSLRLSSEIMDNLSEGVALFRANDSTIVFTNSRFDNMFGYEASELVGQHASTLNADSEESAEDVAADIVKELNESGTWSGDVLNIKKDGTPFWSRANVSTFEHPQFGTVWVSVQGDITDHKQAEAQLQATTKHLQDILNSMSVFVGLYSTDGILVEANDAPLEAAGLKREDVIGKPFWDTYWWSYSPEVQKQLKDALKRAAKGEFVRYDAPVRVADGEFITIDVTFGPLYDSDGRVYQLIGSAFDITDRKRAESRLLEREREFRLLADNVPGLFIHVDAKGCYTFVNKHYEEWFDVSREDILGKHIREVVGETFYPKIRDHVETALRGKPVVNEAMLPFRSVGDRWVNVSYVPDVYNGEVQGFFALITDITERKKAERALRVSEARLNAFFNGAPVGMILFDDQLRYLKVNKSLADIDGFPVEDYPGKTVDEVVPEIAPTVMPMFRRILETGEPVLNVDVSGEVPSQPGVMRHWITSQFRIPGDELETSTLGVIVFEITERKRVEAERETLIEQLEHKNDELERFTYTVSHDLKSPLITIKGFLGLLEKELPPTSNENGNRCKSHMSRISKAADRMTQLLDELLELSRIGRIANPSEAVSLSEAARNAIELVRRRSENGDVRFTVTEDLPVVQGDRVRLQEVLQNLVDNAVKFSSNESEPSIEVGVRRDGDESVCYIRDNGIGIDPRYHEKVFELFEQLDPQHEGTGIGLAVVKRVIETHGGRVWVESEGAGKGSTFCFTIPAATEAATTT